MSNQNPIIGRRMKHGDDIVTVVGAPGFQPALEPGDLPQFFVPILTASGGGDAPLHELEDLPAETEAQPGVVNSGIIGTGEHAWPGPWVQDSDGDWLRLWRPGWAAVDSDVWAPEPSHRSLSKLGRWSRTVADARRADAILAALCKGPDPHPYPDALLASWGDTGEVTHE